jgi:hypothetical protein
MHTIVQPPTEHHSFYEIGSSVKVIIPSRKNYFSLFFLGFWLVGWAFGEIMVGGIFLAGVVGFFFKSPELLRIGGAGLSGGGLFMLAWLSIWTVGGGFALYTFFWQLAGKEIIEISYDSIKIQRAIFGFGRTKEYLAAYIKDFRVSPMPADNTMFGWSRASSFRGISGGPLTFDYGSQKFRFGAGADEAEAKQILEKVVARFPQYRVRKIETG